MGAIFAVELNGNWLRPLSGMHMVSFDDVLISFEIEISISEDDVSRQTIQHRSVIDNLTVN